MVSNISVVIPTMNYNSEYLLQCIQSIEQQKIPPSEIIIVNNSNNKINIKNNNSNIKIINTVNRAGASQARNIGATLSSCEYVAFLDDDDMWGSNYISEMKLNIDAFNPDCLIARLDKYENSIIKPWRETNNNISIEHLLTENPGITGSTIVVKKSTFLEIGGFNVHLTTSEDKSLIIELLKNKKKIISVNKCQSIHRIHNNYSRLTSYESMAIGLEKYIAEYGKDMNNKQIIINKYKLYSYMYKTEGKITTLIKKIIYYILKKII